MGANVQIVEKRIPQRKSCAKTDRKGVMAVVRKRKHFVRSKEPHLFEMPEKNTNTVIWNFTSSQFYSFQVMVDSICRRRPNGKADS